VNGEGQNPDAPLAPDATGRYPAPPHNETGHSWHHDDNLLVQIITEGGMGSPTSFYPMPPFGSVLSEEDIRAVIEYIKTMWTEEQRQYQRQITEAARTG
jgi:mono/diheme cytochrome c family protein